MSESGLTCQKIIPAPNNGIYQGAFLGDNISEANINNFSQMAGTPVDLALKFLSFSTGLNFPATEAQAIANQGGTIFIKLEPWSYRGRGDQSFKLDDIIAGKYDHLLKRFAEGAKNFGKPIFVSFGHEMNGNWYPWAGNPELYIQAYRHVHEVISQIACNITWVWNPNINDPNNPAASYYPGNDYVDWVAVDGYNWSGTIPIPQIFSSSLEYLKTLGKPIMIGEFACANDNPACLSNFIDFVADPSNHIRAFVYFNKDKEKKWAISTTEEKQAYREVILRHQVLFSSSVQTSASLPTTPALQTSAPQPSSLDYSSMPKNFDLISLSPSQLRIGAGPQILGILDKLRASEERISQRYLPLIKAAEKHHEYGSVYSEVRAVFREYIVQWILNRENGTPNDDLLIRALNYRIFHGKNLESPYWQTKAALIIATSDINETQLNFLHQLGLAQNLTSPNISRNQRLALLKEAYEEYQSRLKKIPQKIYESLDPLIMGEIELHIALYSEEEKEKADFLRKALDHLREATDEQTMRRVINKRMSDSTQRGRNEELNFSLGEAQTLKAQALLFEAGRKNSPLESFQKLLQAYDSLIEAASKLHLAGLQYLQIKILAAECLIRIAFLFKDLETIPGLESNESQNLNRMIQELQNWEKKTFGNQSPKIYQTFFRAAKVLIGDGQEYEIPNESILSWIRTYNEMVTDETKRLLWLKQMATFAQIWLANMHMVEAGEIQEGTPREYKPQQLQALKQVEANLRSIIEKSIEVLDHETEGSVNRLLAENLARQGFIAMDLGRTNDPSLPNYQSLFDEAKALLLQAIATGRPEVKAEARLWMAKILLVEAGRAETKAREKELLEGAKNNIEMALAQTPVLVWDEQSQSHKESDQKQYYLKGVILSSAFQTYGDILSAQKDFVEAEKRYRQALGEAQDNPILQSLFANENIKKLFEKNYFARASLGDILNWRGEYDAAQTEYKKVNEDHPAYRYAELGLAEIGMRKDEAYPLESIETLERLVFEKIFVEETPGSFLIQRALEDLIEAYGANENFRGKSITLIEGIQNRERFTPRFQTKLYLKLAEAYSLTENFDKALEILNTKIPSNQVQDNPELNAYYQLLLAEVKMRSKRDISYIERADLEQTVSNSKDPDLITRLILDQIEGYSYDTGDQSQNKENYQKIIELVGKYISPTPPFQTPKLNHIHELFKGRELSFNKFRFTLWRRMAEALSWSKRYEEALHQLELIYQEAEKLESHPALTNLMKVIKAQVSLLRGQINLNQRNFSEAEEAFTEAANLDVTVSSKEAKFIRAWAYFGLGEIYRYGSQQNYNTSRSNYLKAENLALTLPERSEETKLLLARIYLGLAGLEETWGHAEQAATYFNLGYASYDRMENPPSTLATEVNRLYRLRQRTLPSVNSQTTIIRGNDGRSEYQETLGAEIPLDFIPYLSWLHLTLSEQMDFSENVQRYSTYLGAKIYLGPLTFGLEGNLAAAGGGENLTFLRQPYLKLNASGWWKYFNFHGSVALNQDERLNAYYTGLAFRPFANSSSFVRDLNFVTNYNNFNFTYLGDFQERHQLDFGLKWEIPVAEWLKIQLRAAAVSSWTQESNYWKQMWGGEFGGGLILPLGRVNFNLGCAYQWNPEYPIANFNLGIGFQF